MKFENLLFAFSAKKAFKKALTKVTFVFRELFLPRA
jgi:hypothetical protein